MKKIFLVITLLTTFFLSPVKADTFESWPYFYAYSNMDLSALGMGSNVTVSAAWFVDPLENGLYSFSATLKTITNMYDSQLNGRVIIDVGTVQNPATVTCDYQWASASTTAYVTYMGITFPVDNFQVASTGNGFKWFSSEEDNPSSDIDLSTIQNYLLIISFLLFINFLRG